MQVRDLIAALRECEPAAEVVCLVSWDDRVVRINSVDPAGAEGNVVLSDSVPKKDGAPKPVSAATRKRGRRKKS